MIRKARAEEHIELTEISFASKKYWRYPEEFLLIWQEELTISKKYILENEVYVLENQQSIAGYYSLISLEKALFLSNITLDAGNWLEHMFLRPAYIGRGFGTKLFHHCRWLCQIKKIEKLKILADPNAQGFYAKMGCAFIEDYPSTIAGRTTPYLEYKFKD